MRGQERGDGNGVEERFIGKQVTFPYTIINRGLYVGLLEEKGKLCAPLTSLDPQKTHFQFEEIIQHGYLFWRKQESRGLKAYKIEPCVFAGERMDINPALEVSHKFGTIEAYKLGLSGDLMREVGNAVYREEAVYEINVQELIPDSLQAKHLARCKFYHYSKVTKISSDIVTQAGFARLLMEEVLPGFVERSE